MKDSVFKDRVKLDTQEEIWSHFFTVAPLVVIGTKEEDGYDLAPKHMVTALGHENYFGFVCTPKHATYHNVKREKEFTVSFIQPNQVVLASLAASPRCGEEKEDKPVINNLPTHRATQVDALWINDAYLWLECRLDRIIDGFGEFSLIAGKVVGAYVHRDALRVSDADEAEMIHKMPLLAYLPYGRFAAIKETRSFPFPKDFRQKVLKKK